VDTREDHWRRITVIDMDENESLKNPSQHLAVFNSNGEFTTASLRRNKITFWPQPVEHDKQMTMSTKAFELKLCKFYSLCGSKI
jgi:hypothetical protein